MEEKTLASLAYQAMMELISQKMTTVKTQQRFRLRFTDSVEDVEESIYHIVEMLVSKRLGSPVKDKSVSDVARWLCRGRKPWLLLQGKPGNGKTTLAMATCFFMESMYINEAVDANGSLIVLGTHNISENSKFIKVRQESSIGISEKARNEMKEYEELKKSVYMFIDDLGVEPMQVKNYGNEISPVCDILYDRYNRMAFTLMTSNLTRSQLGERYGERISDRMNELMDVIPVESLSYRK